MAIEQKPGQQFQQGKTNPGQMADKKSFEGKEKAKKATSEEGEEEELDDEESSEESSGACCGKDTEH